MDNSVDKIVDNFPLLQIIDFKQYTFKTIKVISFSLLITHKDINNFPQNLFLLNTKYCDDRELIMNL